MVSRFKSVLHTLEETVETLSFEHQGNLFSLLISTAVLFAVVRGIVS